MGLFSDIWDSAKDLASKAREVVCSVARFLFETVFWLVEVVFSAVVALFDMIDSIIESIGKFFGGGDSEGGVLPPTQNVIEVIEKYDKEYGTTYSLKAREGKATLGYVTDSSGELRGSKIIGSEKGFDSTIGKAHKRNRIYASKIAD